MNPRQSFLAGLLSLLAFGCSELRSVAPPPDTASEAEQNLPAEEGESPPE